MEVNKRHYHEIRFFYINIIFTTLLYEAVWVRKYIFFPNEHLRADRSFGIDKFHVLKRVKVKH